MKIPAESRGHFRSREQARAYSSAQSLRWSLEEAAGHYALLDQGPYDQDMHLGSVQFSGVEVVGKGLVYYHRRGDAEVTSEPKVIRNLQPEQGYSGHLEMDASGRPQTLAMETARSEPLPGCRNFGGGPNRYRFEADRDGKRVYVHQQGLRQEIATVDDSANLDYQQYYLGVPLPTCLWKY